MSILKPLHNYFIPSKVKILASERYCLVTEVNGNIVGIGAIEKDEPNNIYHFKLSRIRIANIDDKKFNREAALGAL